MPYTVAVSFDKFRENIELSGDHRETATARKDRIISLLGNDFEILDAFATGSIPRFTAVRGHADLDVMVVLHFTKHIKGKKPSEVLQAVRDALGEYRTNVRKSGQAVTLSYKTWPDVDIVPVSKSVNGEGAITHYNVPNMNTESWIVSKPRTHSKAMSERNEECGPEFKRIVKMIKWWNHQHSNLLQSYHIEVMALETFTYSLADYSWDVFKYFDNACTLATSSLWHDGDFVDDYLDSTTRGEVIKRLETARDKARNAWYLTYGEKKDHEEAIAIWRQIFGSEFPVYGS
jgi:hypothetical protein